ITIYLQHHEAHTLYYDVTMPPEAAVIIQENPEWTTLNAMVPKVQSLFPEVTSAQIYSTWTTMSETLWKRDVQQLWSAEILLQGYSSEVDVFGLPKADGVEQLAWGVKKVSDKLQEKVVEVGIDATCA
ncbi:hypothetical protein L208DRAFT_1300477, partial [Tricholoma matsutake]